MFFDLLREKSAAEKKQDEAFIRAAKTLKTLAVKDGCVSVDISELDHKVRASRDQVRRFVSQG